MLTGPRAKAAAALAYICFALSVLVTPSPAHSQWIENGAPVCTAPYVQEDPASVSDGAGGAIIAWEDDRPDWFTDIYAHQVEYDGTVETELLSWSVSSDGAVVRIAWALSSIEEDASFKLYRKNLGDELFVKLEGAVIDRDGFDFPQDGAAAMIHRYNMDRGIENL